MKECLINLPQATSVDTIVHFCGMTSSPSTTNDTSTNILLPLQGVPALDNTLGAVLLGSILGFM